MNAGLVRKCVCLGFVLIVSMGLIFIMCANNYAQSSKKVGKLNFQVPEDWPIEKRGGLMTPIPTEEYMLSKFKEIEKEFQTIGEDFSEAFKSFESDLKSIEEGLSKEIKKRQSESEAQGNPSRNLAGILSNIELLKGELARLDRKITNKIKSMQAKLEDIDPQIEFINENLDGLQTQIYRLDEKIDFVQENRRSSY